MEELLSTFQRSNIHVTGNILISLLLSFILSQSVAVVYRWTYTGLSYSRSFVQSLVLSSMVTCTIMLSIGNNIAAGLGMLGALSLIRFRTQIRDPRDIIFIFAALALGIGTGSNAYLVSIIGALFYCMVALYLYWSPFSSLNEYEGLLRFICSENFNSEKDLLKLIKRTCAKSHLISLREASQGENFEYTYQIQLFKPQDQIELIRDLRKIDLLEEPNILMKKSTVEL